MNAFQLKKIALTLSLSAALSAQAAGLGVMTSSSKLGEPLSAEIELLAVAPNELSSIQAALASEQFYQDQLLEKPNAYPFIKIEVASSPNGQPILKLSSSQPITEAFLDMLIQVDWPTGRLVKEYTLLLDPPGINTSSVTEPLNLPSTETVSKNTAPVTPKPNATPTASSKQTDTRDKQEVLVKAGDNLHQLAEQLRPDNVTHTQMLAALYQANPNAFDGQNMNRLKVGKVLRMPSPEGLAAMDQAQALSIVNAHLSQWQAYKNGLAGAVKTAAPNAQRGNAQSSAGKIEAPQPVSEAPAPTTKDVLKLSAGDSLNKPADSGAKKSLEAKLNGLQEDLIAKENAIQEEKSRALALEKQLEDMKKLLALKNDAMAKLQANAANPPASPPNANANASALTNNEANTGTVGIDNAPETAPANTADERVSAVDASPTAPQATETPSASTDKNPAETTQVAPAVTSPAPEATVSESQFTSFLAQRLKQMHPSLWVGLVVLPILGVLWLWTRVRRKKQINIFEEAIMTSPATEMQSNTVFGHTQATTGDTSFLTDFSQSAVGGMIDAHEVDPIAEAEVYMAYGRDAQAEEILKDAMLKDPRRQELKVKLLEIYQATNNAAAFDSLAETLHSQIDPSAELWSQVAAMGRQMNPQHALYRADTAYASTTSAATRNDDTDLTQNPSFSTDDAAIASTSVVKDLAFSMPATKETMQPAANLQPKPITLPALDFEEATSPAEHTLDLTASGEATLAASDTAFDRLPELSFALDTPPVASEKVDTEADNQDEYFDSTLSIAALSTANAATATETAEALATQANPAFDLTLDDLTLSDTPTPSTDASDALEMTLGEASPPPSANDEVDTKLDLIKAYIDMEDAIGARELIEEVMTEGNPAQQALAATLLKKIA